MPDEQVYPLLEHTSHFHVRGCREGQVQTRFVDNAIDFDAIIPRLHDVGYDGWLTVEYVHDDRPGCSECDNIQEVVLFRDYLTARLTDLAATANRI
jgi:sugar phosphate isomerase/epimerase